MDNIFVLQKIPLTLGPFVVLLGSAVNCEKSVCQCVLNDLVTPESCKLQGSEIFCAEQPRRCYQLNVCS